MSRSKFYDRIKASTIERQVEDVYNEGIAFYFKEEDGSPLKFTYPYACDGLIETKTNNNKMLKLLMEYKFNYDFTNRVARAKVITQALFYIKRFETDGLKLPNVVLIGDINECFVFHTNDIIKYLDKDINWKTAASGAAEKNPDLVLEIANDENLNPFIFVIDENFSFKNVVDKIVDLAENVQRYVHVTEHNISNIFDYFTSRVVKNPKKISPNDIVAIFIGVITDGDNYYVHPKKSNYICTPFGDIQIDATQYKGFISYFNRKYTPQEKMKFAEISDRLIEDTNRRNKGEFYTPTLFVDYAHKMISEALGDNWKDEYVVWDNCCGTKNLTRDYRFKELYCSTLENAELDISSRYNPEATSFQFDFLNDPLEKLPKGLLEAFEQNKKIVFFLNPPYARNSGIGNNGRVCFTKIREDMNKNKIGACSANLYAQFLWRIKIIKEKYNLTNCHIGIFCPPLFLCGESYKKFRPIFLNHFSFNNGIQFNAGHFDNVCAAWAISFSIWDCGETKDKNNFSYNCVDNINGEIEIIQHKNLYNADNNKTASIWVRKNDIKYKSIDYPNFTSAITIKKEKGSRKGMLEENSLGFFHCINNCISMSANNTAIFTGASSYGIGQSIHKENIHKCLTFFSARVLSENNWLTASDEYMIPNESHPKFQEFINDSVVYSLFNGKSLQSSLRQVEYKGKLWDIKNEFFWMSKSEIESLANEFDNDTCYLDVHTSEDRFVYRLLNNQLTSQEREANKNLQEITLTPEAQAVLDKANEIVRKTFKYRELFNEEHPEYQINNWDCGWYQIKALAKEFAPDLLKEFKEVYNKLADKMRPMIYELGFLK